eukprot:5628826-Pyramimonas_sp.AAC.1
MGPPRSPPPTSSDPRTPAQWSAMARATTRANWGGYLPALVAREPPSSTGVLPRRDDRQAAEQ